MFKWKEIIIIQYISIYFHELGHIVVSNFFKYRLNHAGLTFRATEGTKSPNTPFFRARKSLQEKQK